MAGPRGAPGGVAAALRPWPVLRCCVGGEPSRAYDRDGREEGGSEAEGSAWAKADDDAWRAEVPYGAPP